MDMADVAEEDFEGFDVVTAFCSLYYLGEAEMESLVKRISGSVSTLILQAKNDTRRNAPRDKALKSSAEYLERLARCNGFPIVRQIGKPGHSRPLLICEQENGSHEASFGGES